MTNIVLTTIANSDNVSAMNSNFKTIETAINNELVHRSGGNNTLGQDLDLNGNGILNVQVDTNNPRSLLTVEAGDARYLQSAAFADVAYSGSYNDLVDTPSIATTVADGFMAAADKNKLDGISSGATANSTDSQLRDRSTHTGTQVISTVAGLQAALDGKAALLAHLDVTATRALALADVGRYLRSSSATAVSLIVEPSGTVAWPADAELTLRVSGAGAVTLVAGSGVTLNAPATGTLVLNQRMSVTLKRVGTTNEWDVHGQTVAA